ncbi:MULTISPECIES: NAD(P)H-binding protein [unclassified Streptomyces]|uniref:NAD(P)H-binding protein n=1 Tax=unclassified Streptomyces TaxID=2593676 RepID=UPI002DD8CDAA|nr:NAD(P)H-binding protein [Streptomyces sp. NBC_01775]WSB79043.1 NAD(P)H-binding protein [Streptomyces sp. NBC_01775]WSS41540.1 NAD(P)H-binding protein [Streptomyces sp. NBC_01187]
MSEILVTGATGNVGRQVALRLLAAGNGVRALVRDPGSAVVPTGATAVGGDLSAPDTLEEALTGAEAVFLIWPFLTAERAPAVLEKIAGHVRRVVYVSSSGVREDAERQTDPINQLHADIERLTEKSGPEWTVLRADTLASNALGWAEQIRTTQVVRGPDIAATAVVHEGDVAAVAARALTEDGHAGARHILTGPRVLSRTEQVETIGEVVDSPARFEKVPVEAARQQMLADGRPPALVEALLGSAATRPASQLITSTVEEITGAPARTFRAWAEEHADDFR